MLDSTPKRKSWFDSVIESLEELIGHRPSEREVAESLGMTVGDLRMLVGDEPGDLAKGMSQLSDCEREDEEQGSRLDPGIDAGVEGLESIAGGGVTSSALDLAGAIRDRARRLPPLHRRVLALYYFENLRLPEIARSCGESEASIAKVQAECIEVIQQAVRDYAGRKDRVRV